MQCPRCRAENREGRRFCGECGLSFASACPSCGFLNEGSEKFCGGCGKSLAAAPSQHRRLLRETLTLSARPSPAPAARTVVELPRAAPRSVDSIHVRKPLRPLSHGGGDCQEAVM